MCTVSSKQEPYTSCDPSNIHEELYFTSPEYKKINIFFTDSLLSSNIHSAVSLVPDLKESSLCGIVPGIFQ